MNKWMFHGKIILSQISALLLTVFISSHFAAETPLKASTAQVQVMGVTEIPVEASQSQSELVGSVKSVESVIEPTSMPTNTPTLIPTNSPAIEPSSPPRLPTAEAAGNGGQAASVSASPESRTVSLINEERARRGLSTLSTNDALTSASRRHAKDMCDHNRLDHTGSDGSDFSGRARDAGFSGSVYGEVVGMGYESADAVFAGWMASSGHHHIIMNPGIHQIGVGWVGNCQTAVVAL